LFGEFHKRLRQTKTGLGLREFCRVHGFDPGNLSRLERGELAPPRSQERLEKHARCLRLERGSDDLRDFFDLAALSRGAIPNDIMKNPCLISQLPMMFRELREKHCLGDQPCEQMLPSPETSTPSWALDFISFTLTIPSMPKPRERHSSSLEGWWHDRMSMHTGDLSEAEMEKTRERISDQITEFNSLQDGRDTGELIEKLGRAVVTSRLRVFRIMRKIEEWFPPIFPENLSKAAKDVHYPFQDFTNLLAHADQMLARRINYGYLKSNISEEIHTISEPILDKIASIVGISTERLLWILQCDPKVIVDTEKKFVEFRKVNLNRKNERADYPLNIMIYSLREYLKNTTGKYEYERIAGFLSEQGIIMDAGLEVSSILRRAKRYSAEQYEHVYNVFREISESAPPQPNLDAIICHQTEELRLADNALDDDNLDPSKYIVFPTWEDYLPPKKVMLPP
jgi:hypothetical protein